MMNPGRRFDFRALELHGVSIWDVGKVRRALEAINRYGMNVLVLHESDVTNRIVFPTAYFDAFGPWKDAPLRRGENAIHNDRVYLRSLLRLAKDYGVGLWLELKELTFSDEILERFPRLIKNGTVCPTEPVWFDYIETKYAELVCDFPGLKGIILSPGSPEGRSSLSQRKCGCPTCVATDMTDWYRAIIAAVHKPLAAGGVELAVREFSYKPDHQRAIVQALENSPPDIIFCAKVTPHDFYLTFPDNDVLGQLKRQQWIEYDVNGQYFGWGIFPAFVHADLRRRLDFAMARGVSGGVFRVEWERINDLYCLDTLNRLNLMYAAAYSRDGAADSDAIMETWLAERGQVLSPKEKAFFRLFLDRSWDLIRKTIHVGDHVFHDSSMFPMSIARAWWTMEDKHSLYDWQPSRRNELDRISVAEVEAEKKDALEEIRTFKKRLSGFKTDRNGLFAELKRTLEYYELYAEGFLLVAGICFVARDIGQGAAVDEPALAKRIAELESYRLRLVKLFGGAWHPHQLQLLMNPERVAKIIGEARSLLNEKRAI